MPQFVRRKTLLLAIAGIGFVVLAFQLTVSQTWPQIGRVPLESVLIFGGLAIVLQLLGHWLRAVKHHYMLRQIRPIRRLDVFRGQIIGLLFNTILPLRLGELVRAHYIGKQVSISRAAVFATIMFERWLDAAILLGVGLILLFFITQTSALLYVILLLFAGTLVLGIVLWGAASQHPWALNAVYHTSLLFNKKLRDRLRLVCWSGIYSLKNVLAQTNMPRYVGLSFLMWLCYGLSTFALVAGLLPAIPAAQQIVAAAAAYFGVALPSGPAYLGSFLETFTTITGFTGTLAPFGLWLLIIGPTSLLGFIFLLLPGRRLTKKASVVEVLKNKLYRDADITKEFSHFLDAYFKGDRINHILNAEQLAGSFQVIKTFKGGSKALTVLVWQDGAMVVKKITLRQYQDKLRDQFEWLQKRQKLARITKVLRQHANDHFYAIDIEYREEYTPFFDFIHSSTVKESAKILDDVCTFMATKIHTPQGKVKQPGKLVRSYIATKAIDKVADSASASLPIAHLLGYETLVVNGRELINFHGIVEKITQNKQAMADLTEIVDCPIHGDLPLDNILVDQSTGKFLLIDPNNENAISDPIVDYAKMMQSLHSGYDFLITLADCQITDNHLQFEERRSTQYASLFRGLDARLKQELTPGRYRALLFHEAIHYTRMLTYKVNINPKTAPVFYGIAVRLFNNFMEQYEVKDA